MLVCSLPKNMELILPNTSPIPHIIIRKWMPRLKDVELRVLLVITDQTLGWVIDPATGRRKEKDWISRSQLMQKTGRGHSSVSSAIETLARYGIIEAYNDKAKRLKTSKERSGNKVFYRLNLAGSLPVDNPVKTSKPVQILETQIGRPVQNLDVQKVDTTKSTYIQKLLQKGTDLSTADIKNRKRIVEMRNFLASKFSMKNL
jgi:hypothetical protein